MVKRSPWLCSVAVLGTMLSACAKTGLFSPRAEAPSVTCLEGEGRPLCYQRIGGRAVYQGDILIDPDETGGGSEPRARGALLMKGAYRKTHLWKQGKIPYTIDPALPNPARVHESIAHFHEKTSLRWVPRTRETDYVTFRPITDIACYSWVGRMGGQQFLDLDAGCGVPETIHEMGHAVGMWHEQGRSDRDRFIDILRENILPEFDYAFDEDPQIAADTGPYDYHSTMHYPPDAFSKNGKPTITRKNGSTDLGPGPGLSAGDVAGLLEMYGPRPTSH